MPCVFWCDLHLTIVMPSPSPPAEPAAASRYGRVAADIMARQGWRSGEGLGAAGQGRTDIVKPSLKFDAGGLGHDRAKEFTDHWWDAAYVRAANSISVHSDDHTGDVVVKTLKRGSKKRKRAEAAAAKKGLYAKFVKSSTLTNGQEVAEEKKGGETDEEEEEEKEVQAKVMSRLTDEQLFEACDGMTAHKGARHGHRMSGKQARLEAMERRMLAEMNATGEASTKMEVKAEKSSEEGKKKKKKKKDKKKKKEKKQNL